MKNRQLLAMFLGACLSVSLASVQAADRRDYRGENVNRDHYRSHADVTRDRSNQFYRNLRNGYQGRHANTDRHFSTHNRFSEKNRGYGGFLLGFGLGNYYRDDYGYNNHGYSHEYSHGYSQSGFRARHHRVHDRHCRH